MNKKELLRHYTDHAADFGARNAEEYEMLADQFLGQSCPVSVLECKRKRGDIIRFNHSTDEYGVLSDKKVIRTYFKPVPRVTLTKPITRKCHNHATNLAYFHAECLRP